MPAPNAAPKVFWQIQPRVVFQFRCGRHPAGLRRHNLVARHPMGEVRKVRQNGLRVAAAIILGCKFRQCLLRVAAHDSIEQAQ